MVNETHADVDGAGGSYQLNTRSNDDRPGCLGYFAGIDWCWNNNTLKLVVELSN